MSVAAGRLCLIISTVLPYPSIGHPCLNSGSCNVRRPPTFAKSAKTRQEGCLERILIGRLACPVPRDRNQVGPSEPRSLSLYLLRTSYISSLLIRIPYLFIFRSDKSHPSPTPSFLRRRIIYSISIAYCVFSLDKQFVKQIKNDSTVGFNHLKQVTPDPRTPFSGPPRVSRADLAITWLATSVSRS